MLLSEYTSRQPRRSGNLFSLTAGQKLSGVVLRLTPSAAVSGRIVDEDGDPLAGVQVQLLRITYSTGQKGLTTADAPPAATDDRGIYRIAGVTPGRYYLTAAPPSMASLLQGDARYVRTYYPGAIDAAAAALIDLAPGAELENIGLKFTRVQTVHIRGQVLGARPADIGLYPEVLGSNSYQNTRSSPPDGKFSFDGVLPGAYQLRVKILDEPIAWASRSFSVGPAGVDGLTSCRFPAPPSPAKFTSMASKTRRTSPKSSSSLAGRPAHGFGCHLHAGGE